MSPSPPALEAVGIEHVFGAGATEVVALRGVDLSIARGELVALLGPSGSGKSTLLGDLGLVRAPSAGRVSIDGQPVFAEGRFLVDVGRFRRERLGFVFQRPNLIPFLTAEENVRLPLELDDRTGAEAIARARQLLGWLGVLERADHYPSTLSGGEQQRVAVARALANRPALVLADEPTAALDRDRGRQVMELFRQVARDQGAAVLVVTHDHRALDVFDRTLEMEDGRLSPGIRPAAA